MTIILEVRFKESLVLGFKNRGKTVTLILTAYANLAIPLQSFAFKECHHVLGLVLFCFTTFLFGLLLLFARHTDDLAIDNDFFFLFIVNQKDIRVIVVGFRRFAILGPG
jgi:hypothetical protein